MRAHEKLLTCMLLAVYGSAALLGYGLHALSPHAAHHHGINAVACATHSGQDTCDCAFHRRLTRLTENQASTADYESVVTNGGCAGCSHQCEICTLLVQMGTARLGLAPQVLWQFAVSNAPDAERRLYWSASFLGPQAPRGPPVLTA